MFCRHDHRTFHVTNIYGPASSPHKMGFATWLMNVDIPELDEWVIAGDFDLIKNPSNSFKPGSDLTEINLFNEIISDLGLVEIRFSDRNFTWSNSPI